MNSQQLFQERATWNKSIQKSNASVEQGIVRTVELKEGVLVAYRFAGQMQFASATTIELAAFKAQQKAQQRAGV